MCTFAPLAQWPARPCAPQYITSKARLPRQFLALRPLRCTWSMNFDSLLLINYPAAKTFSHISSQTIPPLLASLPIFSLFRCLTTTSAAFFPGARHHHHRREPQTIVHFFLRSMLSLDAAVAAQLVTNLPRVASKSNSVNSGGGGQIIYPIGSKKILSFYFEKILTF